MKIKINLNILEHLIKNKSKMNKLFSFSLYDVGNSVFPMIIIASITSSYFVNNIADNPQSGTALWQLTVGLIGIIVAIVMPYLGKLADSKKNGRVFYLRLFTFFCIISISCFWLIKPDVGYIYYALLIFLIGGITYEISNSFYNAALKNCYPSDLTLGSGIGFGAGFLGGVILFILLLQFLILPENNLLNLNKENFDHIRFIHLILAVWFFLFAAPLLFICNINHAATKFINGTYLETKSLIWKDGLTNTGRFLLARLFYVDGLVIITTTIGIFGTSVLGLSLQQILFLGILANTSGAIGCVLFSYFLKDDKKTIIITLIVCICLVFLISINSNQLFFMYLVVIATFFTGPLQSSSRVVMANLTDDNKQGFSFGLFTLSGKITAFLGPILASILTILISQRIGFAFSIVLLSLGLFFMIKVNYNNKRLET